MDTMMFYIQTELRKLESTCSSQMQRLPQAKTMRDVKQMSHLTVKAELRCLSEAKRIQRKLETAAGRRMEKFLDEQLKKIASLPTAEDMKQERGRLLTGEWQSLRGDFSRTYRRAEQESAWLCYAREKREKAAASAPEEPDSEAPKS